MNNKFLYFIMAVCVAMIIISLFKMHKLAPARLLSDGYTETDTSDRFIRTYNFKGVQRKNIIEGSF